MGILERGGGGGGGGGEFGTPAILVESSLLLTGVVNRRSQQLDAPRNCQNSDCPGQDDCFCIP